MKLLRYTADLGVDGENNPHDKCYCKNTDDAHPGPCYKKGGFDVFKCMGAPVSVTNPHFYNADPSYLSRVEGLYPEKVNLL